MGLETEKSHNLLSASWGTGEAGGTVQFESRGLRTPELLMLSPRVLRTENQEL